MIEMPVKLIVEIIRAMSMELRHSRRHIIVASLGLLISVLATVLGVVSLVDTPARPGIAIVVLGVFTIALGIMVVTMRVISLGPTRAAVLRQELVTTYLQALDHSNLNPTKRGEKL